MKSGMRSIGLNAYPTITTSKTFACQGLRSMLEHCYIQAIEIVGGRAVHREYRRACGRCATVCHNNAVEIRISDPHFLEKTRERIRSHVKYD